MNTGQWTKIGTVISIHTAQDGTVVSYLLNINGFETARHRRYMRKLTLPDDVEVQRAAQGETGLEREGREQPAHQWGQNSGGQKDCELRHKMGSKPYLTFLLVYSATVSIALIITSALHATNHSTVVCKGRARLQGYAVVDASEDEIVGAQPEDTCKCHCNCKTEEMITGVEVFILTF